MMKMLYRGAFISVFLSIVISNLAHAQYNYSNEPILNIINDIHRKTSYQFLYRDALVAGIRLSFSSSADSVFGDFKEALQISNLKLRVDEKYKQAIIYQKSSKTPFSSTVTINGQVVDGETGERLPYATIQWSNDGVPRGASSNESGDFTIHQQFDQKRMNLKCSYVGYSPEVVTLDFSKSTTLQGLTFRLQPKRIDANNLVVVGGNYYSNINQRTANLVDIGTFSPLGESNTVRALQTLPSVSPSPALSDGLHVRGSPTDGFRVLVDNITIFNQTHLFGLVDSFNADVLKRSGFYYDIAPAKFKAPPGGTLSLLTKTGSLTKFSGSAGLSNASARLTLEGPIKKGKSSWLISGRKSYLNTLNWFNNYKLVKWGLDVNRKHSNIGNGLVNFQSKLVKPGETDASFFDLHGKVYVEGKNGNRLILSGYFGGDNTQLNSNRLFRNIFGSGGTGFDYRPVSTNNDWQNGAASGQYKYWLGENLYATTMAGTSIYQTKFNKDDFTYIDAHGLNKPLQAFIFAFKNESVLNEFKAEQKFEYNANPWLWTGGLSYNYYLGEYYEQSFDRPGYFSSIKANQADAFVQLDYTGNNMVHLHTGSRLQYYSNGEYLKWSPRVKVKLFPESKVSLSGGFSRNYQFLNQIALSNTVTSNVWILANREQPPTSVNYYSSGIYFDLTSFLYAQAEAYIKNFEDVRLHELNTFSLSNTFNSNPWFKDNDGTAKGLEFLLKTDVSPLSLTQTFAVSQVKLSNPAINNGKPFYADWDHTYEYSAVLGAKPIKNLSFYLAWTYASGAPDELATFGPADNNRVGDYHRTDISAEYKRSLNFGDLSLSVSVFNVLNRENPWYRELNIAVDQEISPSEFKGAAVDVYDIGIQPSFNVSVTF